LDLNRKLKGLECVAIARPNLLLRGNKDFKKFLSELDWLEAEGFILQTGDNEFIFTDGGKKSVSLRYDYIKKAKENP
jgi:hypothetical protein